MIKVKYEDLKKATFNKLKNSGIDEKQANIITEVLLYSDIRGIHSHGVLRVEHYINRMKNGGINLNSDFKINVLKPSFASMDADGGFGHVATKYAMEWAIKTANEQGIALIGIKNNSHCGALGYYNKMAIDDKKVSLIMVNTPLCYSFRRKKIFLRH